jgi:HK97 family phage prohead protease
MALKISSKAAAHAKSLISAGKINEAGSWGFDSNDRNALLNSVNADWSKYALWFLVYDDEADEDTFGRYKYPYGKQGKIWRRAVIAIKSRAAQQDFTELVNTADSLLKAIDKKLGKDEEKEKSFEPERRYFPIQEMRTEEGEGGEMFVEGYPIVYEKYADLWGFKEIIRKGAATEALKRSDELVLWDHESGQPMAAKKNGTLAVKEDEKGVFIRADVSKTIWGRNGFEAIKNGVIDKMSFAFVLKRGGDNWLDEEIEGVMFEIREILKFWEIYDYSPVSYPAYEDTSVVARSMELALRNKPEPGAPGEAGEASLEVLKEARDNLQQMRESLNQGVNP